MIVRAAILRKSQSSYYNSCSNKEINSPRREDNFLMINAQKKNLIYNARSIIQFAERL